MMERCKSCSLCQQHCPTQCIPPNRFLIHADRCLTYFNENTAPFPSWVRPQWHNALVGCMHCQYVCPQNHPVIQLKEPPVTFSEEETTQILENTPRDRIAKTLTKKLANLDMNEYYPLLSRNLSALMKREMDKF